MNTDRYEVHPVTLDVEHPFYYRTPFLFKIRDKTTGYVSFSAYLDENVAQEIVSRKNSQGGFVV
jgi:hypothetical protein